MAKGIEFQLCKLSSGDVMYSTVTIVNNTGILFFKFAKSVDLNVSIPITCTQK